MWQGAVLWFPPAPAVTRMYSLPFTSARLARAEPCFPGVAGLTAQNPATVQLCAVQLAQQGAVHREPLRVAVGGRNGIPLRGKQLAEGLVLQGCFC